MTDITRVSDVIRYMDEIAPPYLAMEKDKIGLQMGDVTAPVKRVWVALEATPDLIDHAASSHVNMMVTHHALLFHPLQQIDYRQPRHRAIAKLVSHGISVYSAHTNLDIAPGGVNDVLADLLGIINPSPLDITYRTTLLKLVVYVPLTHLEPVRRALGDAGAGAIGSYSHCTFAANGQGTFLPSAGTNPFIGQPGQLEQVEEARLETVVPEPMLDTVLHAMRTAHPYEEIAYDVLRLEQPGPAYGLGRIGQLKAETTLVDFADAVRQTLGLPHIRYAGEPDTKLVTAAVLGGSGSRWIETARRQGADVMVTADASHHDVADATQDGIAVIDVPHAWRSQSAT